MADHDFGPENALGWLYSTVLLLLASCSATDLSPRTDFTFSFAMCIHSSGLNLYKEKPQEPSRSPSVCARTLMPNGKI